VRKERDASLDNERDTGRLEAFSDGVIAVAITLLILNIHVPSVYDAKTPLLQALLKDNGGISYLGYVISFTIIGLFWANHHYMFKYIRQTDHFLLLLNTLALMCLVFIPFTTALLVAHFDDGYATAAAMVYSASLLLTSILYNAIWWYASTHPHLLASELTSQVVQQMTRRYFVSIPLYIVTLLVSALNVKVSLALYIVIALIYALPANRFPFGKQRSSTSIENDTRIAERKDTSNENDDHNSL
jgi:uncharacterized membrane protein